jgi:hypothetical protein
MTVLIHRRYNAAHALTEFSGVVKFDFIGFVYRTNLAAYGNLLDAAIHGAAEATTDAISKALNEQATSGQGSSTGK